MVDCSRTDIRDALPDLIHDQLEPAARERVEQHLAECAVCAAELALLRSLRASVFVTPPVDTARVVAAVRAGTESARESDATPISAPRERRGSAHTRRAGRRPSWYAWRAAAGIAAVAFGIGGYALSRVSTPERSRAMEGAPVAAAAPAAAPSQAASAKAMSVADVPVADVSDGAAAPASGTLILGDAVTDLSESDMLTLLQAVDDLEALPDLDPRPLPLLARVVEGAL